MHLPPHRVSSAASSSSFLRGASLRMSEGAGRVASSSDPGGRRGPAMDQRCSSSACAHAEWDKQKVISTLITLITLTYYRSHLSCKYQHRTTRKMLGILLG
jgi:hypothetical protein